MATTKDYIVPNMCIIHSMNGHCSFKMSSTFEQSIEMKTKLTKLSMEQDLKVRKGKQSGALKYLQLNKLSKGVGVLYLN